MEKNDRAIPLNDKLLLSMVEQKGAMVEKGRELSREMEALAKQHQKIADEMTALMAKVDSKKLDIFKRVEKLAKKQLAEFEIPVTTEIRDGNVVLIVTDALAEFQESFKTFDKFKEPVPQKKK